MPSTVKTGSRKRAADAERKRRERGRSSDDEQTIGRRTADDRPTFGYRRDSESGSQTQKRGNVTPDVRAQSREEKGKKTRRPSRTASATRACARPPARGARPDSRRSRREISSTSCPSARRRRDCQSRRADERRARSRVVTGDLQRRGAVPASGDGLPSAQAAHRRAWWEYVLAEAEPWHHAHLERLLAVWTNANERFYSERLVPPYLPARRAVRAEPLRRLRRDQRIRLPIANPHPAVPANRDASAHARRRRAR